MEPAPQNVFKKSMISDIKNCQVLVKNLNFVPCMTLRFVSAKRLIRYFPNSSNESVMSHYLALINRAGGLCENLDRGRKYRSNAVRSVHTPKVKILLYRPTKLG